MHNMSKCCSDVLDIFEMLQSDDLYTYASSIFHTNFSLYTSGSFLIYALPHPNLIYIHGIFLYPLTLEDQQIHFPLPIAFFLLPTLSIHSNFVMV